jgi:cytochrome o ubiquinol oxidase subunit 1
MPKNSILGLCIALNAFLFGFAAVWHILWLAIVGLLGIIITIIVRTSNDHGEYTISAAKLEKLEKANRERYS